MQGEISFDLVMEEDMEFVEGTFRLPGFWWQVFIFSRSDVEELQITPSTWDSGVTGVFVRFSRSERLDQAAVERVLSASLGVNEWVVVRGPDSMHLR